tara:strand:- start:90 stop:275 length:186 start_codon:yes stop_codon:yes gene_type:complete
MKMIEKEFTCRYCGELIYTGDIEDEEAYKRLVLHVWQYHCEKDKGISLKETLENGPRSEEE